MEAKTSLKIFIGSSIVELKEERLKCLSIVNELRKVHKHLDLEAVEHEYDVPPGSFPNVQDSINAKLLTCDIAIFLFFSKVGQYTREEFELAMAEKKKIFVYFKKGFSPGVNTISSYGELLTFQEEIKPRQVFFKFYDNLVDFDGLVYKNLSLHLTENYTDPAASGPAPLVSSSNKLIPLAPRPYLAHPYSPPKNFTGRAEEQRILSEWYHFDREPLLVVEAIGGMGKSALTWKWLQDEIIAKGVEPEGIIWWSFYDEPFESFVKHLFTYCIPEAERQRMQVVDEATEVARALQHRRFLLMLDGFERVLRGYAQMMAMYIQEGGLTYGMIEAWDQLQRSPVSPKAERLLRALCTGQSKALMTTRLFPAPLEGLAGVKYYGLTGLSKTDTIDFFTREGVQGTADDMVTAGAVYHYHPLMLKLLASAISRSRTRDIQEAFKKDIINQSVPQKILHTSFALLNDLEKRVALALSVFRSAFDFAAACALFPEMDPDQLWATLIELRQLGFVFHQEQEEKFDFHPIMRSFLYDQMTSKEKMHELAIVYFQQIPAKEKIASLDDLQPVIEQYHHLVRAGKYDEACGVYRGRLRTPLYYQLGEYDLITGLLKQLFPLSEVELPKLKKPRDQSYVLNDLASCYASSGQLEQGKKYFLSSIAIDVAESSDVNIVTVLINAVDITQKYLGQQTLSVVYMQKANGIAIKIEDQFREAIIHQALGSILNYTGKFEQKNDGFFSAKSSFDQALSYCQQENSPQAAGLVSFNYAQGYAQQFQLNGHQKSLEEAWAWMVKAFEFAEKFRIEAYPVKKDFIRCYHQIGTLLLSFCQHKLSVPLSSFEILFYDQHFQNITETLAIEQSCLLSMAERCLTEALTRSRAINLVELEAMTLLSFAHLEWLRIREGIQPQAHFSAVEAQLQEAQTMALRGPYRVYLVDIHIFCAEVLIEQVERGIASPVFLLGKTAAEHLALAKEYALDLSTYEEMFLPKNPDAFYKGIPEYAMLKRGMTEQERIENGYYVAWQVADRLEGRCH